MLSALLCGTLLFALASYLVFRGLSRIKGLPYPPGPPPSFITGNLTALHLHKEHIWLWYADLAKKYGDIVHLRVMNQHIIVLSSLRATQALLAQKSRIYCSRPRIPMSELVGWDSTGMMGVAGPRWRATRRVLQRFLNKSAVVQYHPMIESKARICARSIIENPDSLFEEVRLLAIRFTVSLTYGLEVDNVNNELVKLSEGAGNTFSKAAQQGAWLVNSLPILKHVPAWFPFARFQRQALEWRPEILNSVQIPYARVKGALAAGKAIPSLVTRILESNGEDMTEDHLKWFAGGLYSAAVDTSTTVILNFVLAMVLHPEAQKRAQDEIDSVIGHDRLPDISDRERLPYVERIFKETVRWQPAVPTSLPYWLIEDDVNDGYFLPQWSIIIANTWAISRDETTFHNPEVFRPDRWEDESLVDPTRFAFGYGRRICGGMNVAEAVVWATIATMLATVNFTKACDSVGREIIPKVEHVGEGLVRLVKKFQYEIQPRSPNSSAMLSHAIGSS